MAKRVIVVPYNEQWKTDFETIKQYLLSAINDVIIGIEHIGSTSVDGLSAKPVIDIDVVIKDYSVFDTVVEKLATLGYIHEGNLGIKDREAFDYKADVDLPKHHLYVCPEFSAELRRHITFRDYLRNNPEAVLKYSKVKEEGARLFPDSIDDYIAYKSPCIEEIYKKCGLNKYKAIFFDRDGTLTYFTAEKEAWRDKKISEWSGKPFELDYDKMMDLFHLASEGRKPWYKTLQDEQEFFKRYYYHLLVGEGVTENVEIKAEFLLNELWCNGDRALFSETIEVLEYFKKHDYKMGVISDTSPSLEFTLQQLGIAEYFTSFTASSLVGAGKPSPIIFNAALEVQGVTAEESIFVDDCKEEADGAREQGFTAFYLDRSGENNEEWTIHDLKQLIDFINNKI
ncbi:MAG: HAD family hydrolase [Ruminococcaceae bacterium]|nr:HAD family hydrolase [Oscillospiraceae bacterium]